jgi:hypothetical protein
MALGVVEAAELRGVLPQAGVGSENAASALTLVADLIVGKPKVSTISMAPSFAIISVSIGRSPHSRSRCRIKSRNSRAGRAKVTYDATHLALP